MSAASAGLLLSGIGLCLTGAGLFFTAYTILRTSRSERAKWASQLAHDFYSSSYRDMREVVDGDAARMEKLIQEQPPEFTEFLNFLELVAFLRNRKQIKKDDVEAIFGYYLRELKKHEALLRYLRDPLYSYGELAKMLADDGS